LPRVDEWNSRLGEIFGIARGQRRLAGGDDSSNHDVADLAPPAD